MEVFILVVGTSVWVILDANSHGIRNDYKVTWYRGGPVKWGLGCLLLWIPIFPTYVRARKNLIRSADAAGRPPARSTLFPVGVAVVVVHLSAITVAAWGFASRGGRCIQVDASVCETGLSS